MCHYLLKRFSVPKRKECISHSKINPDNIQSFNVSMTNRQQRCPNYENRFISSQRPAAWLCTLGLASQSLSQQYFSLKLFFINNSITHFTVVDPIGHAVDTNVVIKVTKLYSKIMRIYHHQVFKQELWISVLNIT